MSVGNFLHYTFVACFLISFACASWKRNQVTLQDGGYEDLLIAIDNEETVDDGLIENIKEIFTKGSSFLFEATGKRVYWKSIKILVPSSWPRLEEYVAARTETFERANVIITGKDDGPYVLRAQGCGVRGEQMYLSPKYVRDKDHSDLWGPRDKTIVHEWAHLRWGVFDEYPYPEDPSYFIDNNKIEATRCSRSINGKYRDANGGNCKKDPKTGVYTDSCRFTDENTNQYSQASLMYKHFLPSVVAFCSTNANQFDKRHYEEAPNDQNRLCNRQGVWDVMMKTYDFKDGNSPTIEGTVNVSPTFTILQPTTRRVVLVLDVSGSMEGPPLEKLRQAAIQYLGSTVPNGTYVGIVSFNTAGYQLAPLTLVDTEYSRYHLQQLLPTRASGGTSIGSGVLKGIQLLSSSGQSTEGGYLIVISDGENTDSPDIRDVIDDVINAGVIVDTVAITPNADSELESLSTVSGGLSYFYRSDSDSITVLVNALKATITDRPDQTNESLPITLYNEALSINATTGNASGYLYIESNVGVDTIFSFTWLYDSVMASVQSPDGHTFNQSSDEYNVNSADKIITISISGRASVGYWNFRISTSPSPSMVTVIVESKQASEDVPVTVTSFVSQPSVDYLIVPYITIFAFVTKDNEAVANADVIAIVERPNAPDDVIQLYDSGSNSDIQEYDGVYSAYFFNFTGDGRYNVEVKVRGTEETSIVKNRRNLPIQEKEKERVMEPAEMFQRSTSGGSIQVYNYVDNGIDILEPSQIMDLTNIGVSYQEQSVTLQWTAVGDDLDKGTVTEYDIRFTETFQDIAKNFSEASKVTPDDVIIGDLDIKEAGQLEQITIKLPNRGDRVSYYFAVVAIDDANNTGLVSNIVSANLEYIPPVPPLVDSDTNDIKLILIVVISVVGVIAIVMFTIIIKYLLKKRRSTTKQKNVMGTVNTAYA